jgi:hypothetical protein
MELWILFGVPALALIAYAAVTTAIATRRGRRQHELYAHSLKRQEDAIQLLQQMVELQSAANTKLDKFIAAQSKDPK